MSSYMSWRAATPQEYWGYPDDEEIVCKHGVSSDLRCATCVQEAGEYERATGQPIIGPDEEEFKDLPF